MMTQEHTTQNRLAQEISTLNEEQKRAVFHESGPLLVLAGAGSGKTRVVTLKIAHLIKKGIRPDSILGVTFTNKAAQEMKERVRSFAHNDVLVCTFHSLGVRILRESIEHLGMSKDFVIYDEDDAEKLLKNVIKEVSDGKIDIKAARDFISKAKNKLLTPDEAYDALKEEAQGIYDRIFRIYQTKLQQSNACDFDDLLYLPVLLFRKCPEVLLKYQSRFSFVLVDEYQDTNFAQYTLIKMLVEKSRNLCVVGDPDQSIYSWRGANVQNILNFEKDYPGAIIIRLEQNYRSTKTILNAANAVIRHNQDRYEKSLWSNLGEGEKIGVFCARSEREEAEFVAKTISSLHKQKEIPLSEIVVFYRTNFQSRVFEDELIAHRIPYIIFGGVSFYLRREIKDLFAHLKLLDNPKDMISFLRIINLPKRGLGDVTLAKIMKAHETSGMPLLHFILHVAQMRSFELLPFSLSSKQKEGWIDFAKQMLVLQEVQKANSLEELVRACVFRTRYLETLDEDPESKEERRENLEELIVKAGEWEQTTENPTLSKFLEEISLATTLDNHDSTKEQVSLMTVHNGKGLEFDIAFVAGLEEDLFPHINSKKTPQQVEEERRLFYVGTTRAKKLLFFTHVSFRHLWGGYRQMRPSRFLQEIPAQFYKKLTKSHNQEHSTDTIENVIKESAEDTDVPYEPKSQKVYKRAFAPGEPVFHPQFGVGKIQRIVDGSLGPTYEVFFLKDGVVKRLVAAYAPLTPLQE